MFIRFDHVTKQFAGTARPALKDCDLTVEEGGLTVVVGPSGCGKSTLLKMVNRLQEPTSGAIFLDNQPINGMDPIRLRRQIGYVIQHIGLFPHMTIAQNISVVPRLLGWTPPAITQRVEELLELVELAPAQYRDRYPAQLSGGQQQRVGLARALAGNPQVMLMDEPFGALDAITRTGLQQAIHRLQRQLWITSDDDNAHESLIIYISH